MRENSAMHINKTYVEINTDWIEWGTRYDSDGDVIVEVFPNKSEMKKWFKANKFKDLDHFLIEQEKRLRVWRYYLW